VVLEDFQADLNLETCLEFATLFGTAATGPTPFGSPSASTPGIFSKALKGLTSKTGLAALAITGGGLAAGSLAQQPDESTEDYQARLQTLIPQLKKNWQSLNPIQEGETPEEYQVRQDEFLARATREYNNKGGRPRLRARRYSANGSGHRGSSI
jgi:hypothetical protein